MRTRATDLKILRKFITGPEYNTESCVDAASYRIQVASAS